MSQPPSSAVLVHLLTTTQTFNALLLGGIPGRVGGKDGAHEERLRRGELPFTHPCSLSAQPKVTMNVS